MAVTTLPAGSERDALLTPTLTLPHEGGGDRRGPPDVTAGPARRIGVPGFDERPARFLGQYLRGPDVRARGGSSSRRDTEGGSAMGTGVKGGAGAGAVGGRAERTERQREQSRI